MGGISDVDRGLCLAPTGIDTWESRVEMVERMRRVVDIKDWIVQNEFRADLRERFASPREMLAGSANSRTTRSGCSTFVTPSSTSSAPRPRMIGLPTPWQTTN
jgi:hypothetical protein